MNSYEYLINKDLKTNDIINNFEKEDLGNKNKIIDKLFDIIIKSINNIYNN